MKFKFSFDPKSFLREKLLLLGALACEVAALLIRREVIAADPELVGRLTVAGVVLMLIWLVIDGLKKTARRVRAVWSAHGPWRVPALEGGEAV